MSAKTKITSIKEFNQRPRRLPLFPATNLYASGNFENGKGSITIQYYLLSLSTFWKDSRCISIWLQRTAFPWKHLISITAVLYRRTYLLSLIFSVSASSLQSSARNTVTSKLRVQYRETGAVVIALPENLFSLFSLWLSSSERNQQSEMFK